jgi:hypothetical protein
MLFSFLYRAVRALFGLLIRCRRGPGVQDLGLLVLRHGLEVVRRQVGRAKLGHADRALLGGCWVPLGEVFSVVASRQAADAAALAPVVCEAEVASAQPPDPGGRVSCRRSGCLCCGSRARTHAGASPDLLARARLGPAPRRSGPSRARVPASAGGEHRCLRLSHGRDAVPAPLLRLVLSRARQSSRLGSRAARPIRRRPGHPAGSQPEFQRAARANPVF